MPNTLAHLGIQTLIGRGVMPGADVKWVLAACVIPDLSWIGQTVARSLTEIDLIDLRLYAIAQTSLLFSLIIAGAFALLSRTPHRTFAILAIGVALHLMLDATQTKWGNGVLFLAPFDWSLLNLGWYWPEDWPSYGLTLLGVVTVGVLWWRSGPMPWQPRWPPMPRLAGAAALLVLWGLAPLPLMPMVEAANLHNTGVLNNPATRVGQKIAFDRNRIDQDHVLHSWTGETFLITGEVPPGPAKISLRGVFTDVNVIAADGVHIHSDGPREWFSYAGLLIVLFWWLHGMWRGAFWESHRFPGSSHK